MATATRVAGDKECNGGKSDGDDEKGCGRATATAPKRAAGDEEGNGEGGESDGDAYEEGEGGNKEGDGEGGESDGKGDKEGDGEEEGEGPHSSSSSDRLPPHHMLPLLLRLATAFRAVVGAALARLIVVSL